MEILDFLLEIIKRIQLTGFIDILFISVFIYVILILFKQSKARLIITGIIILSVIYVIARQINLDLTASLLEAFFAVIILAIIIIFQEEIRRFFEKLGLWGLSPRLRTGRIKNPHEREIGILCSTLTDFAAERTGALVVLRGSASLNEYLEGGQDLNGFLSEPILRSIFDPHSTGHDGALIIDNGTITMFGAHLPLSTNFAILKHRGTRHAAALGLSESTDAMCLVVSEETGSISIARYGGLEQVDKQRLRQAIESFYEEIYPSAKKAAGVGIFNNIKEKIIAFVLAAILWFVFVHESRPVYRTYQIPVTYAALQSGYDVNKIEPETVSVTFLGPRREFYFLGENQIKLLLKIPDRGPGTESIRISESSLTFPRDISLESIEPGVVTVRINERKKDEKASTKSPVRNPQQ